jgi:hypothetical protein
VCDHKCWYLPFLSFTKTIPTPPIAVDGAL